MGKASNAREVAAGANQQWHRPLDRRYRRRFVPIKPVAPFMPEFNPWSILGRRAVSPNCINVYIVVAPAPNVEISPIGTESNTGKRPRDPDNLFLNGFGGGDVVDENILRKMMLSRCAEPIV